MMIYSFFGSFTSEEEMIGSLRAQYPDRRLRSRILAQALCCIWPTARLVRYLEACREIRRYERGEPF